MRLSKHAFLVLLFALAAPLAIARDMPVVDPADFTVKFGKPDRVVSTEYDKPRPPVVTRLLEYKRAGVRIALLANAPVGSPPPYPSWRLMGYQDMASKEVIQQPEAERRLGNAKPTKVVKP